MITVPFPPPQFRIKTKEGKRYIFDDIRKTWLRLTQEEWVRQNLLAYFITVLQYPKAAIALEKEFLVSGLKKRFDILVFDANHEPWMLVECKAPEVALNEGVLQQALRYHVTVPATWIVISNGEGTVAWEKRGGRLEQQNEFRKWPSASM
jgi:hypothetical protein